MNSFACIEKHINEFFDNYQNEILSVSIINEYFPKSHIEYVLNNVKNTICTVLNIQEEEQKQVLESFGYSNNQLGQPILIIFTIIDKLQTFITEKCPSVQNGDFFKHIKSSITRGYLLRDLEEFEYLFMAESEKNPYTNLHFERIKKVINTIREEGNLSKVDIFEIRQAFHTWVNQPETDLILGDEKEWISMLHKAVQRLIHSIVYHIQVGDLFQVYILFKELSKKMLYLIYTLDDLYYMFLEHKDRRLAEYIKKEAEMDVYSHLTIISITNLNTIKRVWGTSVSNKISSLINKQLKQLLKTFGENFLFVQGATDEYFVFSPIVFANQIVHLQKSLKETLKSVRTEEKSNVIDCKISIGSLEMESIKSLSRDTIIKLIVYARQSAKDLKDEIFNFEEKEKTNILEILKKEQSTMELINNSLNNDSIHIYFQPIFDMHTNKLYDLEALVRIVLKDGTVIKAEEFIDMVYQMDKIVELDKIVINKIHELREQISNITNRLFINVSPISLKSPEFRKVLEAKMPDISNAGLSVTMELTEQAFLENIDVLEFIREQFNLSFAVDDFGTGYSSLRTVADLSQKGLISYLKIDGSLIKDIVHSQKTFDVVNTIFKMTNTLKLKAISEYVESEECAKKLMSIGMVYAQGHHFSPASSLESLLSDTKLKNNLKKPKNFFKFIFRK
jgi:EAL domain-containing protein (putative c-di-GMP-specific phosphodiesterase class I)